MYDATPEIFTEFLRFVYSGSLSDDELSVDALSELLQLADRYDVSTLKELCETHLRQHIHSESALALLSVADHFNAISLKVWFLKLQLRWLCLSDYWIKKTVPSSGQLFGLRARKSRVGKDGNLQ